MALHAATVLGPVLVFLGALLWLDGYKLVRLRMVVVLVGAGAAAAGFAYLVNAWLLGATGLPLRPYTRYIAPPVEELLKGALVVALVRMHRVGFLVDAAIAGFAIGAGFSVLENLHYIGAVDSGTGTAILRGFGTAIMHGGATATFAVLAVAMAERAGRAGVRELIPGFALATAVHMAFNHFLHVPLVSAAGIAIAVPVLFLEVFGRSERALGDWLRRGFDADAGMIELIDSGRLQDSPVGRYLESLRSRFEAPIVADILCYVRLHTELALRAKGILLMRESGFDASVDAATRARLEELRYLESTIGRAGLRVARPLLPRTRRDLWQFYMLGK